MSKVNKSKKLNGIKGRSGFFRRWHRRIGVAIALWLMILAFTGILLNHSDDFNLHKKYITSNWIIDLYQIKAPNHARCYKNKSSTQPLCQIGEQIINANGWLMNSNHPLIHFYTIDDLIYLITPQDVIVLTYQGEDWQLVEHFDLDNELPGIIELSGLFRRGKNSGDLVNNSSQTLLAIKTEQGFYKLGNDFSWQKITESNLQPNLQSNQSLAINSQQLKRLQEIYLHRQITLLHFMQDLHSARIFSLVGKWLTDIVALLLMMIILSGLYTWFTQNRRAVKTP